MIIKVHYQVDLKTKAERSVLVELAKTLGFGYAEDGKEPTERQLLQRLFKAKGESVLGQQE